MIFNDRVLCVPTSVVLTDGYFQIIPEIIVHLSNVNTWGIENKCPSFCVWDSRGFELRLDVIYDLAPYQSLNMQIVLTPTRNMAYSLRFSVTWREFSSPFSNPLWRSEQTNFSATPMFSPLEIDVSSSTPLQINLDYKCYWPVLGTYMSSQMLFFHFFLFFFFNACDVYDVNLVLCPLFKLFHQY